MGRRIAAGGIRKRNVGPGADETLEKCSGPLEAVVKIVCGEFLLLMVLLKYH